MKGKMVSEFHDPLLPYGKIRVKSFCHTALDGASQQRHRCGMAKPMHELRRLRASSDLTLEELSERTGISVSQLSRYESGGRDARVSDLEKLANVFGVSAADIMGRPRQVPLIGWVGAGGLEHRFGEGDGEYESVEAPPNATEKTVAVEARGDSLGPLLDNAYIYYDDRRDPYVGDFLGEMCVVGLADGQILVKQIRRGTQLGRYTLYGQFGSPLEDVEIVWAARVKAIIPRSRAAPPGA